MNTNRKEPPQSVRWRISGKNEVWLLC